MTYTPPSIRHLGTVHEMTQQTFNKVGPSADVLSTINPNIIGSITPR